MNLWKCATSLYKFISSHISFQSQDQTNSTRRVVQQRSTVTMQEIRRSTTPHMAMGVIQGQENILDEDEVKQNHVLYLIADLYQHQTPLLTLT